MANDKLDKPLEKKGDDGDFVQKRKRGTASHWTSFVPSSEKQLEKYLWV